MVSGKLSSQIQEGISARQTRTERKIEKREIERQTTELKSKVEIAGKELSKAQTIEEYKEKYAQISEDIKPFFKTPENIEGEKVTRIQNNISEVQSKLSYADTQLSYEQQKLQKAKEKYAQDSASLQSKKSSYNSESYASQKARLKENLQEAEDYFEEKQRYWEAYKSGINEGLSKLKSGEELSVKNIVNYADEKGYYEEARKRADNENRQAQKEFTAKLESGIEAGGLGTFEKPFVVQKIDSGKVSSVQVLIGGQEVYKTSKASEIKPFQEALDQRTSQKEFKESLENIETTITEPTPTIEKSWWRKGLDWVEDVSSAIFMGSSIGLAGKTEPTGLTTEELESRRFDILKSRVGVQTFPIANIIISSFGDKVNYKADSFLSPQILEYQLSKDIRESGETQLAIRDIQASAVENASKNIQASLNQSNIFSVEGFNFKFDDKALQDFNVTGESKTTRSVLTEEGKLQDFVFTFQDGQLVNATALGSAKNIKTDKTPYVSIVSDEDMKLTQAQADIYYSSILKEAENLAKVGVKTKIEKVDGEEQIIFTSKSFELDLDPATTKLLENKSTKGQILEIGGAFSSELLEFAGIGLATYGTGILPKLATEVKKIGEYGKLGASLYKFGKLGLEVGGLGVIGYQSYKGTFAGYELGKEKGVGWQTAVIFGGKPLVEIVGFGAGYKFGSVLSKPASLKTSNIFESKIYKDYQKEIRRQELQTIKNVGQYSERATFRTQQLGLGQKLPKARERELGLILEREVGLTSDEAKNVLKQASIFEQELSVKNVFGKEYKFKKVGIDFSVAEDKFTKQIAFEFKQSSSRISDFTIKTSVSGEDKKFVLTNIFKKARQEFDIGIGETGEIMKIPRAVKFNLDKVLGTKITKFKTFNIAEEQKLSLFEFETRILKTRKLFGKSYKKLNLGEVYELGIEKGDVKFLQSGDDILKVGLQQYDSKFIEKQFELAGIVGKTDIGRGARLEVPYFKGDKIKVANLEKEFLFKQVSESKPYLPMRNIIWDIPEAKIRGKKTPLSKTFQSDEKLVKDIAKKSFGVDLGTSKGGTAIVEDTLKQGKQIKEVNVNALIKDINVRVSGKVKTKTKPPSAKEIIKEQSLTRDLDLFAQGSTLKMLDIQKIDSLLKEKQMQKLGLRVKQQTAQSLRQNQILRQEQLIKQIQVPSLKEAVGFTSVGIRSGSMKVPTPKIPKIPKLALIIGGADKKKKKQMREKDLLGQEDPFVFVESFSARALELKPIIIQKQNVGKLIKEFSSPFAIRRQVIIK